MPFPKPEPGLVLSFAYLWRREAAQGQREGRKTRPCVIVLAVEDKDGEKIVTVAPITHATPKETACAVEIPAKIKWHLGLDDERSWVRLDEVNQFAWPGFDLRPVPGSKTRYDYGFLPPRFFEKIKVGLLDLFLKRRGGAVKRD